MQTGSQRTEGFEFGVAGNVTDKWLIAGGYAYQDAKITSATAAAREGARVGQVPRNNISLWNKYQFLPAFAAGLGVIYRSDMFATIDDTVTLPGYTRVDAALYYSFSDSDRLAAERGERSRQGLLRQRRQQYQHFAGHAAHGNAHAVDQLLIQLRL